MFILKTMILWNFHSNLLKMINICLKNVLDTCRECQINLSGVACCSQTVWSKTEPYYICSTLLKEHNVPLSMCGICYGMSPSTWNNLPFWKKKPFNSRVPCGILWESCDIPACKIFLQKGKGATFLWESFSWFWNITLRCAQHSFRKRVSCLPCIFDTCSIPFI